MINSNASSGSASHQFNNLMKPLSRSEDGFSSYCILDDGFLLSIFTPLCFKTFNDSEEVVNVISLNTRFCSDLRFDIDAGSVFN